MSKVNSSRVQSNLLQQNCFVRDVTTKSTLQGRSSLDVFVSLDEVVTSKGVDLVESRHPYPVTPQYVNSFVESSDYRRDLFSAFSSSSSRPNLGDITDVQKVMAMDTSEASALYSQLKSVFEKPVEKPVEKSVENPVEKSVGGN